MTDNYIKISQLPETSFLAENNLLSDNLYTIDNSLISVNNLGGCIITDCLLPDNTIKLALSPGITKFEVLLTPKNTEKTTELYYVINDVIMEWVPVVIGTPNSFTIIENNQTINNVVLSSCSYINTEQEAVTELLSLISDNEFTNINIFKSINFTNTPIAFLELNDSTLQELYINECSGLKSCILGEFDSLEKITITNTKCHTNIRIGKLSNSPIINLENNQLHHIEFIGNGLTTLTKNNCKVISQQNEKKLKSVCFINCNISDDLLTELKNNNVIVYNLKKAV